MEQSLYEYISTFDGSNLDFTYRVRNLRQDENDTWWVSSADVDECDPESDEVIGEEIEMGTFPLDSKEAKILALRVKIIKNIENKEEFTEADSSVSEASGKVCDCEYYSGASNKKYSEKMQDPSIKEMYARIAEYEKVLLQSIWDLMGRLETSLEEINKELEAEVKELQELLHSE